MTHSCKELDEFYVEIVKRYTEAATTLDTASSKSLNFLCNNIFWHTSKFAVLYYGIAIV